MTKNKRNLSEFVQFRTTPEHKKRIERLAMENGLNLTNCIRLATLNYRPNGSGIEKTEEKKLP